MYAVPVDLIYLSQKHAHIILSSGAGLELNLIMSVGDYLWYLKRLVRKYLESTILSK